MLLVMGVLSTVRLHCFWLLAPPLFTLSSLTLLSLTLVITHGKLLTRGAYTEFHSTHMNRFVSVGV